MHKTGPRREVLFCIPAVYQFILAIAATAAFGDSWSRSSGCTGGRAATSIAPGCIVEAFPMAIAEAFPVCLASGACTDIMAAAAAVAAASTTAAAVIASAATATAAPAAVIAATASTATIVTATSAVTATATATSTITTIPSTSAKSKATHILHSPFLLVCTISYGTPGQSVSDCLNVFYCHPFFFFS